MIRPERKAEPFEALAFAITEQLIEGGRAYEIQRRLIRRWGRRSECGEWRDAPTPEALAACAPAELAACDLAPKRALAMVKVAREVAAGRVDLDEHEPAWQRLRAIREIGSWTVEKLALEGQGRDDMLPAGDLAYVKLVGRLAGPRPPRDRGRGARVLRALRAVRGAGGHLRDRRPPDAPARRAAALGGRPDAAGGRRARQPRARPGLRPAGTRS